MGRAGCVEHTACVTTVCEEAGVCVPVCLRPCRCVWCVGGRTWVRGCVADKDNSGYIDVLELVQLLEAGWKQAESCSRFFDDVRGH